jgi:predicted O-methyltransferase YrrM
MTSTKKTVGRALTPLLHVLFRALQPTGVHLTRNHFYEPVPDTRTLDVTIWSPRSEQPGIDLNRAGQIDLLERVFPAYMHECDFPWEAPPTPFDYHFANDYFYPVDAEVLHSFIRHFKPRRVIEVGSGYSTKVATNAARINAARDGVHTEVICIEPYPSDELTRLPGVTRLIRDKIQDVDVRLFEELDRNDILFIDSSHVVKIGSDVVHEYLDIIPRLRPGVLVHAHDIFIPDEYPREWVMREHKFWTEQYLLQAFLAFNARFDILWASSFMSATEKERLERVFPSWRGSYARLPRAVQQGALTRDRQNVWPVSFWFRRHD